MNWIAGLAALLLILFVVALIGALRGLWRTDTIYPWQRGLLYVDGRFQRVLEPGRYERFDPQKRGQVRLVHVGQQYHRAIHDVVSLDRLLYRLSVAVTFEITDPRAYHEQSGPEALALAVERAAADVAATRTVEQALLERSTIHEALTQALAGTGGGVSVREATVVAVTLPPELRRAYAEVERARQEGMAALERARAEQAALRSLANAARMLKDNPDLLNLRLLQTVAASKGSTLVLGDNALGPKPR